jgi:two-component system, NtrC family, C4-dicarboxylate transport response regulator DctD
MDRLEAKENPVLPPTPDPIAALLDAGAAILVVDDEDAMRQLVALRLRLLGHEAVTARSVDEAIVLLEQQAFGAVVSDARMPGATGLDLLTYVRQRQPLLPYVLMSAHVDNALEQDAFTAGATAVFEKNVLLKALPDIFAAGLHVIAA